MAELALVSMSSRSLLADTAFTFPSGLRLAIFIHLFDGSFGQIFTGFWSHSFRIGLIPPVILAECDLARLV